MDSGSDTGRDWDSDVDLEDIILVVDLQQECWRLFVVGPMLKKLKKKKYDVLWAD